MKKLIPVVALSIVVLALAASTGMSASHIADVIRATRIALSTPSNWFSTLHPLFTPRLVQLIAFAQKKGYTVTITSALRPGDAGYHGLGGAVDLNLSKDGQVWGLNVGQTSRTAWEETGIPAEARRLGLRWGGDFQKTDVVHFDIGGTHAKEELT